MDVPIEKKKYRRNELVKFNEVCYIKYIIAYKNTDVPLKFIWGHWINLIYIMNIIALSNQ